MCSWWWSEGKCLVPHCLVQFLSKVSKHYPPSHQATVNWDCLESQIFRIWNRLWSLNSNNASNALWAQAFDISVYPFVIHLIFRFSIDFLQHTILQAIYLLSINWSSSVSQASQKIISLLFLLSLPFLLLTLNGHSVIELHNCTFLIHCTFFLFCHQACSLWCLDLPADLRVKPAVQPQWKSVSVLLRQGQPKPICCLHTAEMAFFAKTVEVARNQLCQWLWNLMLEDAPGVFLFSSLTWVVLFWVLWHEV